MKPRFSKANLIADLKTRASNLAKLHGFTTDIGTYQLDQYTGDLLIAKSVEYGIWVTLRDMIIIIENY